MEKQINKLEVTEDKKVNKIHLFFKKMDYRIGIFSVLSLVIGFIGGSHMSSGHHKVFGEHKSHRKHCMKFDRSHSFNGDKGGKENGHPYQESRRDDFKKGEKSDGRKSDEEKNYDKPMKEKKAQQDSIQ